MAKPQDRAKWAYMFSDDVKFTQKIILLKPNTPQYFLILKRAIESKTRPNDWDLPGGNVLYGENNLDSLQKEVFEETGLRIKQQIIKPVLVHTALRPEKGFYLVYIGHVYQLQSEEDIFLSTEHTEFKWVTATEFLNLNCQAKLINQTIIEYFNLNL
ncbi:MAG: hypothetical protein OHK0017_06350 [Patescibacteria group bacterium]